MREPLPGQTHGALLGPDVDSAAFAENGKMLRFIDDETTRASTQTMGTTLVPEPRQARLHGAALSGKSPYHQTGSRLGNARGDWRDVRPLLSVDDDVNAMERNFSKLPAERAQVPISMQH